jgi:hypothetical protein
LKTHLTTILNNHLTRCSWDDSGNHYGIKLVGTGGSDRNKISNNKIDYVGTTKTREPILIANGSDNNVSSDNQISNTLTPVISDSGSNSMWSFGNVIDGKPCENTVTATNTTATTFVFNHGLAGTSNYVWASFNSTQIDSWKWTAICTQITITVVNSGTVDQIVACYCQAIYRP